MSKITSPFKTNRPTGWVIPFSFCYWSAFYSKGNFSWFHNVLSFFALQTPVMT
uniref:Uncharacterized protein n=1 Tax=Anguilla anguilla TaxID=7936 RepID=A0A0E9RJB4_ANGAN